MASPEPRLPFPDSPAWGPLWACRCPQCPATARASLHQPPVRVSAWFSQQPQSSQPGAHPQALSGQTAGNCPRRRRLSRGEVRLAVPVLAQARKLTWDLLATRGPTGPHTQAMGPGSGEEGPATESDTPLTHPAPSCWLPPGPAPQPVPNWPHSKPNTSRARARLGHVTPFPP